jgi:hypothetical protein
MNRRRKLLRLTREGEAFYKELTGRRPPAKGAASFAEGRLCHRVGPSVETLAQAQRGWLILASLGRDLLYLDFDEFSEGAVRC